MKTLHPLIIVVLMTGFLIVPAVHNVKAIPYQSPLDLYKQSNMVFYGQVIAKEAGPGLDYNYQIKVETYFKNAQNSDSITVAGHKPNNNTRISYPQFEVGDKAIFYIDKQDGINIISPYSQIAGEACGIHSFLGPSPIPGEPIVRGMPTTRIYLEDINGTIPYIPLTNHTAILRDDDIWNNYPEQKTVSVTLSIQNEDTGQQVFNQTQNLEMQACSGPGTVKWNFVPTQIANYVASVSDNKTKTSMIFQAIYDSTKPPIILSPLQQLKSGILPKDVKCKQDLSLVSKAEDGTPACIKQESISKLILRGWIGTTSSLDQNNRISGDFYQGIEKDFGIVSVKHQTYYMMTASDTTYPVASGMTVKFKQVTFSFPYGSQATPGGVIIPFDMTFPDGTTEAYGKVTKNPDGSGSISGIGLGPGPSANRTITVQSVHTHPQAGVIMTENQIKLLVSTDVNSTVQQAIPNPISNSTSPNGPEFKVGPDLLGPMPHQLVFFMKSNSTAKIFVEYTSNEPNTGTVPSYSSVYVAKDGNFTPLTTSDVTINADPPSIPITKGSDTTVVYTISAKEGVKGVYWISLVQFCRVMPLAIGMNSLTVSPFEIPVQTGTMNCPAQFLDGKILGISGGTVEYKLSQELKRITGWER